MGYLSHTTADDSDSMWTIIITSCNLNTRLITAGTEYKNAQTVSEAFPEVREERGPFAIQLENVGTIKCLNFASNSPWYRSRKNGLIYPVSMVAMNPSPPSSNSVL